MTPDSDPAAGFVVTGEKMRSPYELCGRAIIEENDLVIYLDTIGRYLLNVTRARYLLLLGGTIPVVSPVLYPEGERVYAERRTGGKGLWICRGAERYVIPARSLRPVLEGTVRKAPVFRYEGGDEKTA